MSGPPAVGVGGDPVAWPPPVGVATAFTASATLVLAGNPSPMTLDGTNTWLLVAPGGRDAVVVDAGPDDPAHLDAVLRALRDRELRVRAVLLTHGHPDHSEGAAALADQVGAPVRALDPRHRRGDEGLAGGDVVVAGDLEVRVVATPGHTADSLSFLLADEGSLLTGDTVLGRGTTVVAHPDGVLADYLDSLRKLHRLAVDAAEDTPLTVLPGHGEVRADAAGLVAGYLAHREQRLAQVQAAVGAGARTPRGVVEVVYADVDPVLWPAAELSVRAQLGYLGLAVEDD